MKTRAIVGTGLLAALLAVAFRLFASAHVLSVPPGFEIIEFADSRKAAEARREELKKADVKVRDVTERKFDTLEQTNAGLPPRLRALVSALERRSEIGRAHV